MQHLQQSEVANLQEKILKEKKQLELRIAELTSQDPFSDPERLNDNAASDTEANEESNHDRATALIETLQVQLVDADAALKRIKEQTYGICVLCHGSIDLARLEALPTADLCLACEQKSALPRT